jgi:ribosome-associated translation inhibitor RaiA
MAQVREPQIVVHGDVPRDMVDYAHDRVLELVTEAPVPVLDAQLRLEHHADPARERPDHVEMTLDLDGTPVRAHRHAATMTEAVDRATSRLRRRVEAARERPRSRRLRFRDPSSWHHADRRTDRGSYFPRAQEERDLVRRKTFTLRAESIEDALFDLELLDHDFFLFVHDETGAEAVVYRAGDGYGLTQRVETPEARARVEIPLERGMRPATTSLEDALGVLDASAAPFEFFVDAATGRAAVAYRRYDGNYGLISS